VTDKILVLSTCDSEQSARDLAKSLLEARLAACVNIVPGVMSLYWWQGKIDESAEWLLLIKSSRPLFEQLREHIARVHSYTTPEIVALSIVDGARPYLDWVHHELRAEPTP
jgi:periplasmic divalent cation tolerance protein